ncbi:MAG: hypothetical protein AVDCRST_MAG52-1980, partial [uncultured Blastococcus sp.]
DPPLERVPEDRDPRVGGQRLRRRPGRHRATRASSGTSGTPRRRPRARFRTSPTAEMRLRPV